MSSLRIAAVIPARLQSTRMARKVLRPIAGRPMVEWVWRAAQSSGLMDPVVVATDAEEVAEACRARSIPVVMTSPDCPSGSDRVREVARQIDADSLRQHPGRRADPHARLFPAAARALRPARSRSLHALRPLPARGVHQSQRRQSRHRARRPRALLFARHDSIRPRRTGFTGYRKHLGIYAYRKAALERFASLPPSPLEKLERLEQLRLLENGIAIYVADAPRDTIGVDTEEDLVRAEALLTRVHEKP